MGWISNCDLDYRRRVGLPEIRMVTSALYGLLERWVGELSRTTLDYGWGLASWVNSSCSAVVSQPRDFLADFIDFTLTLSSFSIASSSYLITTSFWSPNFAKDLIDLEWSMIDDLQLSLLASIWQVTSKQIDALKRPFLNSRSHCFYSVNAARSISLLRITEPVIAGTPRNSTSKLKSFF